MDPGVAGLLSMFSSGVGGTEESGDSDIAVEVDGSADALQKWEVGYWGACDMWSFRRVERCFL